MTDKRDTARGGKPAGPRTRAAGSGAARGPVRRKRRLAGPRPSRPAQPAQAGSRRRAVPQPVRADEPETETPKLHKVLAQAGLGSRLQMEQVIGEGRVSVNGSKAHVGQRVMAGDRIRVDGRVLDWQATPRRVRVLLYHKPAGELVTHSDPQNRPTIFQRLPRLKHGKWQAVGRLDLNTEGLLLVTDSGWLANRLMHPRFGMEREYAVRILGGLDADKQRRLLAGVTLEDGEARFASLREGTAGDGVNRWYHAVIAEGRNREVRRMVEAVGHAVSRLIRVRYGPVVLPRGLRRGKWLELDATEVARLVAQVQDAEPVPADPGKAPDHPDDGRARGAAGPATRRPARKAGSVRRARPPAAGNAPRQRPPRGSKAARKSPR
ncbi:MAG: pseudouridine synthase [Ottowia sp.]|nr:pseudouridine synthase [Ottowia sp.]